MSSDQYKCTQMVSIVIPVYNRAHLVANTLDSIKKQIYRPLQLVIIDDGSQDDSVLIVEKWKRENESDNFSILIHKQENLGAPAARNTGIALCNGKYIQFLDSDDLLSPNKINSQVIALEKSRADIAVCDFRYVYSNSSSERIMLNDGDLVNKIARGWSVSIFAPLMRVDAFYGRVWWNLKLKRQQDLDFLFKIFCLSNEYVYTPGLMCDYIQHDSDQISDRYRIESPQFFIKVSSLIYFWFENVSGLSKKGNLMILKGLIRIIRSCVRFYTKKSFSSLFGEALTKKIHKYIKLLSLF